MGWGCCGDTGGFTQELGWFLLSMGLFAQGSGGSISFCLLQTMSFIIRWESVERNMVMLRTKAYLFQMETLILTVKPQRFVVSRFLPA